MTLTREQIDDMCRRLDDRRSAPDIKGKYREAFCEGLQAAKAILGGGEGSTPDEAISCLRKLLAIPQYLSLEKTEAYHKGIRSAMSMLHALKKGESE